jgi:hypothetical protein
MIKKIVLACFIGMFVAASCFAQGKKETLNALHIESEASLNELLKPYSKEKKQEASGVVFVNENFYVVFDNHSQIARLDETLKSVELLGKKEKKWGYEGITYDKVHNEFYVVEESIKKKGKRHGRLSRLNKRFEATERDWLKYDFKEKNRGFEGLSIIQKNNENYIMALCEGNRCMSESPKGGGRIIVFKKKADEWQSVASIELPATLLFDDYSGMDIDDGRRLVIASQQSSALWIGRLDVSNWRIVDQGRVFSFPRNKKGNVVYCNVEGVSWMTKNRLVTVSDARKDHQEKKCKQKAQSIHIVSID